MISKRGVKQFLRDAGVADDWITWSFALFFLFGPYVTRWLS